MLKYIYIIGVMFLLLISCDLENPESKFDDYSTVVESGMIKSGWVPDWLPESATNIYEQHNIDTNETFMEFSFSGEDIFYNNCKKLTKDSIVYSRYGNQVLINNDSISFFDCSNDTSVLAVDIKNAKAYFWR